MDFERDRHGEPDPQRASTRLLLGPGRPHELQGLLRGQDPAREVLCLSDLADLLPHESARAVLDGRLVPTEDLGILHRALQSGRFDLTLLGGDPSTGSLRQLLKHPRTGWIPYPPDSEELARLSGRPAPTPATEPQASQENSHPDPPVEPAPETSIEANPPKAAPPKDPDLAEIEAILSQPVSALQVTELPVPDLTEHPVPDLTEHPAPDLTEHPAPDVEEQVDSPSQEDSPITESDESAPTANLNAPIPESRANPEAPIVSQPVEHPWFKDQVADLADMVQTIYASTSALQAEGEIPGPLGLYADALRLVQFTRTLGYLASPPARGDAEIDLSELSEELLRSAGAAADAPRFLMRTDEPLTVCANKELLVQAMDAILVLSRLCAGPEGEVRLSGKRTDDGMVTLHLGFPCGPLEGLTPEQIVVPYALRSTMPDMGKNALRAAARIVEGQGGSLELTDAGDGRLRFSLSLPAA